MRGHILRTESYKKGFAYSSLLSVADNLLGFIPSLLVAFFFGAQSRTDVYFYCVAVLACLVNYCSHLNAAVIIPESMRIEAQEGTPAAQEFLNVFLYGYLAVGMVLTLVFLKNPVAAFLRVSRFDASVLADNAAILYLAIPLLLLQLVVSFLNDILYSRKYFTIPMLSHITNRVMVIASLLLLHRTLGVLSLMAGLLASFLLQALLLTGLLITGLRWRFVARVSRVSRRVVYDLFYAAAGGSMSLVSAYLPFFLLSGYAAGVITALNFAKRLVGVPMAFITSQASSIVGIKLNELCARGEREKAGGIFRYSIGLLLFVLMPITLVFLLFSREIVTVLFKRGAFDARAVGLTAMFFGLLSLTIPPLAVNTIAARLFMAARKIRPGFWYQVCMNVFLATMILLGVRRFGVVGYPAAEAFFNTMNVFILYFIMRKVFPEVCYGGVLAAFVRILCLNAVVGVAVWASSPWLRRQGILLTLGLGGALTVGLVLLLNGVFPACRDFNQLLGSVWRTLRPRRSAQDSIS